MPSYQRSRKLAAQFDKVYPQSLVERIEWWSKQLEIDQVRFLRMFGMSKEDALKNRFKTWHEILSVSPWEENAWRVEGMLHRLLSHFDYDLPALVLRLHREANRTASESEQARHEGLGIVESPSVLNGDDNGENREVLLNDLARGGPQAMSSLVEYLMT